MSEANATHSIFMSSLKREMRIFFGGDHMVSAQVALLLNLMITGYCVLLVGSRVYGRW
jgi:hypothetical protein